MSALSRLLSGELSCRSRVFNAQAADTWVMEVVIPEKEARKTALSAPTLDHGDILNTKRPGTGTQVKAYRHS